MGKAQLYFSRHKYSTYLNTSEHSTYGLHRSGSWSYPQHDGCGGNAATRRGEKATGPLPKDIGSGPVKRYSAKCRILSVLSEDLLDGVDLERVSSTRLTDRTAHISSLRVFADQA